MTMARLLRCRAMLHQVVLGGVILFCMAPAPVAPPQRPALELRKLLNFLLEGSTLPNSGDSLANIIAAGLKTRLMLPPGATPVTAVGAEYPNLDRLLIDFSNARIDSGRPVARLRPIGESEQVIHAREFNVTAEPMNIDGAAMHLKLKADDVALGVQRDKQK